MRLRTLPLLAALVLFLAPAATAVAAPTPFGTHACVPQDGVRFCPGTVATRVPTFDGVPLDADVALPATGDTGLPLIVDGSLSPWTSPGGKPMGIAAAVPIIPWTDLAYPLEPNGRTLDYTITGPTDDFTPIGVEKRSLVSALFALGQATGYYSPPGIVPESDLTSWFARVNAGEPSDSTAQDIVHQIVT